MNHESTQPTITFSLPNLKTKPSGTMLDKVLNSLFSLIKFLSLISSPGTTKTKTSATIKWNFALHESRSALQLKS